MTYALELFVSSDETTLTASVYDYETSETAVSADLPHHGFTSWDIFHDVSQAQAALDYLGWDATPEYDMDLCMLGVADPCKKDTPHDHVIFFTLTS